MGWAAEKRRILASLSAANLALLPVWNELLYLGDEQRYFTPLPTRAEYLWLCVSLLALALLVFALLRGVERRFGWGSLAHLAVLALLWIDPLNFARILWGPSAAEAAAHWPEPAAAQGALVALAGLLVWAALRARRVVAGGLELLLLLLSPLCLGNAAQALWAAGAAAPVAAERPAPAPEPPAPGLQRTLWITFDELDGRELFAPGAPPLPAFAALRDEATWISRARPPGGHTLQAMPSLWLGERVRAARATGPSRLEVETAGAVGARPLSERAHLFAAVHAAGARTALVGFYHPYCRLFAGHYQACRNASFVTTRGWAPRSAAETLTFQWRTLTPFWRRSAAVATYRYLHAASLRFAPDSAYDFVALHRQVPHAPPIYDRARERLAAWRPGLGYADNLALADRALGEIAAALRRAGLWETTAVVVSSDHGWRERAGYDAAAAGAVPIFVKLPGHHAGGETPAAVEALVLPRLLLALLTREVASPEGLERWLARHAAGGPPQAP